MAGGLEESTRDCDPCSLSHRSHAAQLSLGCHNVAGTTDSCGPAGAGDDYVPVVQTPERKLPGPGKLVVRCSRINVANYGTRDRVTFLGDDHWGTVMEFSSLSKPHKAKGQCYVRKACDPVGGRCV